MNKNIKTTLIVALSLFGAGIIICLCVSLSVHFDYKALAEDFQSGYGKQASVPSEHIEKSADENGQSITLNLSSADLTLGTSKDDKIHISYDNTQDLYYELKESASSISLTQKGNNVFGFGFSFSLLNGSSGGKVVVEIPSGHEGEVNIYCVSGDVSASELELKNNLKISEVSGNITLENSSASDVSLETTSGDVYAENVKSESFGVQSVSGGLELVSTMGRSAKLSTVSGEALLRSIDFSEIVVSTVSGDISGTLPGSAADYTVYADTLSGSNSLSSHREHGARTLDLSSTSGSFKISFEK